ncbi:MAG: hypothetical protein ACRDBQ_16695 [Shewanella sp.]
MGDPIHICRKVFEWRDGFQFVSMSKHGAIRWFNDLRVAINKDQAFSKEEWIKERNALIGRPSWSKLEMGLHGYHMIQTSRGNWFKYRGAINPNCEKSMKNTIQHGERCGFGEVLGDWRLTLEKAPYVKWEYRK